MSWLIGFICIILFVVFWRIFLPLALIAAVGVGMLYFYSTVQEKKQENKRIAEAQLVQERIRFATDVANKKIANSKLTPIVEREWEVMSEVDPASGENIPRSATVLSDEGLCRLQIEQRTTGVKLAGIYCPGLTISASEPIDVKFDNRSTSDRMKVGQFSNSTDVFISSQQSKYDGNLQYDEFLRRMPEAKKVALQLKVKGASQFWTRFSLAGSKQALIQISAISPQGSSTQSSPVRAIKEPGDQIGESNSRLPANSELNYSGHGWMCKSGFSQSGNECVPVQIPANAELNYSGHGWMCKSGFSQSGNECVPVQIPANAELNYSGHGWMCKRGFQQSGNGCVPVGVT